MDQDWAERQAALRARAKEAITAALSAAKNREPSLGALLTESMDAITLACWDAVLAPSDRLVLLDDALLLLASLKTLAGAPPAGRPALLAEVYRRTAGMLRRHARLVRVGARPNPHDRA
jgi:hypothetical protein